MSDHKIKYKHTQNFSEGGGDKNNVCLQSNIML